MKVKVVDVDGKQVEGARVVFRDREGNVIHVGPTEVTYNTQPDKWTFSR